jgi:hypothetical protein
LETGDSAIDTAPPVDTSPPPDTSPAPDTGSPPLDTGTAPPDPCAETTGSVSPGDDWDVEIDDFSGDGETTEPKEDANDGGDGDNPYFQRNNVARGHCSGDGCYWYTSSHQESGEPDPDGSQYVDYVPPFDAIGVGWWTITAHYRQSDNRADYPAVYRVVHRDGEETVEQDQRDGSEMENLPLGTFWMCPGDYVRVEDTGGESITMNAMDFERG